MIIIIIIIIIIYHDDDDDDDDYHYSYHHHCYHHHHYHHYHCYCHHYHRYHCPYLLSKIHRYYAGFLTPGLGALILAIKDYKASATVGSLVRWNRGDGRILGLVVLQGYYNYRYLMVSPNIVVTIVIIWGHNYSYSTIVTIYIYVGYYSAITIIRTNLPYYLY